MFPLWEKSPNSSSPTLFAAVIWSIYVVQQRPLVCGVPHCSLWHGADPAVAAGNICKQWPLCLCHHSGAFLLFGLWLPPRVGVGWGCHVSSVNVLPSSPVSWANAHFFLNTGILLAPEGKGSFCSSWRGRNEAGKDLISAFIWLVIDAFVCILSTSTSKQLIVKGVDKSSFVHLVLIADLRKLFWFLTLRLCVLKASWMRYQQKGVKTIFTVK